MRIGAYQFAVTGNIDKNWETIKRQFRRPFRKMICWGFSGMRSDGGIRLMI